MSATHRLTVLTLILFTAAAASAESGTKRRGSGSKPAAAAGPPAVGDSAPAVSLTSVTGEPVDLAETFESGKTVLVVLRGYPGYQCGICSRIASGFIKAAPEFAAAGVEVVMVYPGASVGLGEKADEFLGGKTLPEPLSMVLDPDYALVNAYNLRWNAPNETAYPSTFIIDSGTIEWAKISRTHGGRASAKQVLTALGG